MTKFFPCNTITRLTKRIVSNLPFMANSFLLSCTLKEANFHANGIICSLMHPFFDSMDVERFVVESNNHYEPAMSQKFVNCLSEKDVFIDVGASYGYYSLLAAKIVKTPSNIHAFEPIDWIATVFELNNRRYCNGNVTLSRLFVGNKNDSHSITLDQYCLDKGLTPNVIKMDIEGGEYMAIDGMKRILKEDRPIMLIELHERILRERYRLDAQKVVDKIGTKEYQIKYNGHHYYMNTHGEIAYEWTDYPPNDVNYALFCYPRS